MAKAQTTESGTTTADQEHQAIQAYLQSQDWEERLKSARVERAQALARRARERGEGDGTRNTASSFDLLARAREISATAKAQMDADQGLADSGAAMPVDDVAGDVADDGVRDARLDDPAAQDFAPPLEVPSAAPDSHGAFPLGDLFARTTPPSPVMEDDATSVDHAPPQPTILPDVTHPVSTAIPAAVPDLRRPTPLAHRALLGLTVGMAAGLAIGLLLPVLTQGWVTRGDVQTIKTPLAEAPAQPQPIAAAL